MTNEQKQKYIEAQKEYRKNRPMNKYKNIKIIKKIIKTKTKI